MKIEDRIRMSAHGKIRVMITPRKRSRGGFTIFADYGTAQPSQVQKTFPSRRVALQFLLAIVRCQPARTFIVKPAKR